MQQLGLSPTNPKSTSRLRELLWPDISDTVAAKTAARNGMYASFFVAGATILAAVFGYVPRNAVFDAVLFFIIGMGIRWMSRFAAAAGLVLYLLEQLSAMAKGRVFVNFVMLVILTALFVNSVRATWLFRRLGEREAQSAVS